MRTENVKEVLARAKAGNRATVEGWLRTVRHSKSVSFLEVSDGSSFAGLQAVVSSEDHECAELAKRLGTGCAVRVEGELTQSPGRDQSLELRVSSLELIGDVADDYPLQKKRHGFEFLRTIAHLRPRTNTFGAVLRVRNVLSVAVHEFFQQRGFIWLHSPIITTSDCEGAGEMFRVSALDPDQLPRDADGRVDYARDFFGNPAFLTVSGQLEAEVGASALSRVYTFGPTFRAENSNTSRHLAEFWMIEPEMAFCDQNSNAEVAEAFLKHVLSAALTRCPDDMAFFDKRIAPGLLTTLKHVVDTPFEQISYREAIEILQRCGRNFEFSVEWGADLQSEHERFLCEEHFKRPLIVRDYPSSIKPFYMYVNEEGETVRAMDVLVSGVGEIIGGSQREHRFDVLERRIAEQGLKREDYWWYLDLRRHGSVPHSGFGLGFERLVQFATGMANIRDVIPFPRVPGFAEF